MKYGSSYPAPVGRLAQRRLRAAMSVWLSWHSLRRTSAVPSAGGDAEAAYGDILAAGNRESYSEANAAGPQSA